MSNNIKSFDNAHNKKLKSLSKEERLKANLKKLALELENNEVVEPKGLASGKMDSSDKMIIDLEEDYDDE